MPTSTKTYRPETRLVHAGTLRSQFGETSEALFLTQGYVYPTAEECEARFSGKNAGLRLFALFQPDHDHVRAAHGRARRRGSCARDRDRHGGGDHGADGPGARRRSCGRRQGAVRLLPLGDRGMAAALRRHLDAGRRHRSRCLEEGGAEEHQGVLYGNADQSDAGSLTTSRRSPISRTTPAPTGGRQCFRHAAVSAARWSSAPTASSIRRPSTSTDKAACSAASSWRPKNSSWITCTRSSGRPGRHCRRSMPGCC